MSRDQRGFTLVELLAILIIVGIIFSIVAIKFSLFTTNTTQQMIDHAIIELNNREKLVWTNLKLSFYDGDFDEEVQRLMKEKYLDLGNGTQVSLDSISVQGLSVPVQRSTATNKAPAMWSRQ